MVEAAGVEPASEKVYRRKATCVSGSVVFVCLMRKPARERQLSLIGFGLPAPDGSFRPILRNDALGLTAGPSAPDGYLKIKQRMQTADWQLLVSDRFTGARNPARLPTTIQSRRIRFAPIPAGRRFLPGHPS